MSQRHTTSYYDYTKRKATMPKVIQDPEVATPTPAPGNQRCKRDTATSTVTAEPAVAIPTPAPGNQRPKRLTAQQCLLLLQDLDDMDSGEETLESDMEEIQYTATDDDDVLSDVVSGSDYDDREVYSESGSEDEIQAETVIADSQVQSKDGTKWSVISDIEVPGRLQTQNVFTARCGTTAYCRNVTRPVDAFRLLLDEGLLRHIKSATNDFARLSEETWDMTDSEFEAFIGLMYLRGCMNARNFPLHWLWSDKYGCKAFPETMARNRFKKIKKYLRFDNRATHRERLDKDKSLH